MFTSAIGLVSLASALRSNRKNKIASAKPAPRRAARATHCATLEVLEGRELLSVAPALDSSAHSAVYGQGITLTAIVAGGGTGVVTFLDGAATLGTAALDGAGKATLFTASLPVGNHSITASYGDATSAPLAQAVNPALTTTALTSSVGLVENPILRPDHVVIVMEEDRFSQAVGDAALPYINQLAASGLVYANSHGVNALGQQFGELNYLALYSGSTHGIADDGPLYSFSGPNVAKSLADAGLSFTSYAEGLPSAGDVTTVYAADPNNPLATDAYARYYNPAAMFTDIGAGKTNTDVNKPFSAFPTDYSALPTVSFVIPNRLHNTHGSNETPPFANDPDTYHALRQDADTWLANNLDGYLQWARTHNSLLIVTTESGTRDVNFAAGGTTVVNGDSRLFVSGVNDSFVTHYNVLRTIEAMYGLAPIGDAASAAVLDTDVQGKLSPGGPVAVTLVGGQAATYTATVSPLAPAAGMPSGTVQFVIDNAPFGAPVALVNGSVTLSLGNLSAGTHLISASYFGDTSFSGGRSSVVSQSVTIAATTTTLTSSAASVVAGQPVTLTAVVARAGGTGTPTGTVTFKDGTTTIGSAALDATGHAALTLTSLAAGTHSLTAFYGGDASNAASTSAAISQVVTPAATTVGLVSSAASAGAGQTITFTATVARAAGSGPAPTGTVTFKEGNTVLGTAPLNASGAAVFATSALPVGTHFISASYAGDANNAPSVSPSFTQNVIPNASTVSLATNAPSVTVGQNVVFTATVAAAGATGALKPGGMVAFFDGTTRLGAGAVDAAGKATFATAALAAGTHSITALYSGDSNFAGSLSAAVSQQVLALPIPTGPANDTFANRITVVGAKLSTTGTNVGAALEAGEPMHGGKVGGKSVWWSWKATKSGLVTVETLGSNFNTLLGVYTGSSLATLKKVTGVPLTFGGNATFSFVARVGQTYQIAVDGVGGAAGNIKLAIHPWHAPGSGGDGNSDGTKPEKKDKSKHKKHKRAN